MSIMIIIVLFIAMMIYPLVRSFWFYKTRQCDILFINQNRIREPRYFAISFTQMIEEQLEKGMGKEKVYLSQKEKVFYWNPKAVLLSFCKQVVIAVDEDFIPPGEMSFYKEVYAMKNAKLTGPLKIRSIACKGDLIVNSHVEFFRWADAVGTLRVGNHCDLGICVSSMKEIIIGGDCKFRRIYAPVIYLGCQEDLGLVTSMDKVTKPMNFQVMGNIKYNMKYITESHIEGNGCVNGNIVTKYNLTMLEDITLVGSLRSEKKIRICDNGIITGNIFADEDIIIGQNVMILGNVFSQGDIKVGRGTIIGEKGKRSSVVARGSVFFEEGCMVYGYVSNEKGGVIA